MHLFNFTHFLETTYFATLTEGYSKNEIARAEKGNFLTVNVSMSIVSFLEVDEIGQTLKVVFEMKRTWFDARLTLWHLQNDNDLNVLWERNYAKIWYPNIQFENIDPSKNGSERYLLYMILRTPNIAPTVRSPGTTNGTNVFKGSEHKISRSQEYTYYWRCVYDLRWYPFDRQTCNMFMNLPKHYLDFVRLHPESIEYKGKKDELTEYLVEKIVFCSRAHGINHSQQLVFEVCIFVFLYFCIYAFCLQGDPKQTSDKQHPHNLHSHLAPSYYQVLMKKIIFNSLPKT